MTIRLTRLAALAVAMVLLPPIASAQINVFVDFTSTDAISGYNNPGGAIAGANGIADWIDLLNTGTGSVTQQAGVAAFTPVERATIETNILNTLNTAYGSFNVTFTTTSPGGTFHTINLNANTTTDGPPSYLFGNSPLDWRNFFGTDSVNVFTHNYDYNVEAADARATQIAELSAGLGGTAAHELGHALGLRHHHAYAGDRTITPTNYAATGGAQNQWIIATGSTGLNEAEREAPRGFGAWESLIFESAAGGALATTSVAPVLEADAAGDVGDLDDSAPVLLAAGSGSTVADTTLLAQPEVMDAGNAYLTAQPLTLTLMPVSGLDAALVAGVGIAPGATMDTPADVDYYSFNVTGLNPLLSAEVWSTGRWIDAFDAILDLYDVDGTTLLATNDNVAYDGDLYDAGTVREDDPFLLNIPLTSGPGTYYLAVRPAGTITGGEIYDLLIGISTEGVIPEPASLLLLALAGALPLLRRHQ